MCFYCIFHNCHLKIDPPFENQGSTMSETDKSSHEPELSVSFSECLDRSCFSKELVNNKLSKNQQKKLRREEHRKETKTEWRKLQKAKRKLKEQLKKEEFKAKGTVLSQF